MATLLLILGGLVLVALAGIVLIFSLGQGSVTYELHLTLLDAAGQPLPPQPVVRWDRSAGCQQVLLNAAGQLRMTLSESFGASVLLGPRRPAAFAVRLSFPALGPLYYWFEVKRSGPVHSYQVFNDYYSYGYTKWVGDFDAQGFVRRRPPGPDGKLTLAVAPRGGQVARWQATAALRRTGHAADGSRHYTLGLTLQQSGVEVVAGR